MLGLGITAWSQDQIITKKGDTINCKITRVSDQYIHYIISEQSIRTRILREEVQSFTQKEEPVPDFEEILENPKKVSPEFFDDLDDPPRWRLALNGGYTYQFGGYENNPPDYAKKLRPFFNLGSEFHFFPSENLGIGIKFNRTASKVRHEFNPPLPIIGAAQTINNIDEKVRFTYVALSVVSRKNTAENQYLTYGLSAGVINYKDIGTLNGNIPLEEEGQSFGINFEIGYDFVVTQKLGLGFNAGLNLARINQISTGGSTISNADFDVSRFDVTLGIRFLGY